ncbi:MAG: hypothetical protein J6C33_03735 [Lachnospiraceae bacterium]|nr:hypothetical protein [Lachnospiraceae bacterium]
MTQLLILGIVILLFALAAMLFSRSQSLQRFAVLEFLLLLGTTAAAVFGACRAEGFMRDQYFDLFRVYISEAQRYAGNLEDTEPEDSDAVWQKRGDDLEALLEASLPVTTVEGEEFRYLTAGVYERVSDGQYEEKVYRYAEPQHLPESECLTYVEEAAGRAALSKEAVFEKTDRGTGVLVYTGSGAVAPRYAFLTEIPLTPLELTLSQMRKEYMLYGAVFLLTGTLFLAGVIYLQGRQIRSLVTLASRVAAGKEDWDSLKDSAGGFWLESNEMRGLKNSLGQISTDVARMNYRKYRILQGYYRFAPKQIETILGKSSILDVTPNDRVHITGTLAFISYPENEQAGKWEYLNRMNGAYEQLSKKQKEYGGILLSDNNDLTTLQLLFQEETKKALYFGIDMATSFWETRKDTLFVLLHRTAFLYGVAGNEEQAFTYALSKEMKALEKYVARFRSLGIRMAATDSVYELIEKETAGRYIGYLEENGNTFKLYEILDACPAGERGRRLAANEKFQKALNLFYQGDYYLGRNLFTEALKECPDDEVAKRYLFLCEKCLNGDYGKTASCALFPE